MKRVALFLPGGVGNEASGVHIPMLVHLIDGISDRFSVTVYPLISPATEITDYRCGNAVVRNLRLAPSDHLFTQLSVLAKTFLKDHRRAPFDLIHGFWALPTGLAAVTLAKMVGLPSIVSVLGAETAKLPAIDYGNMRHLVSRRLTIWACRHAGALIALTHNQVEALQGFGVTRNDVHVIPPTAAKEFVYQSEKTFPHLPLRCLHVAHLNEVKDQATLLGAFARIVKERDARLRIAGRDYMDGSIQRLAESLGVREKVEFLGFQTQLQLVEQYAWTDILLHTSLHEGGGVVIAEAAAASVVVCGTDVGLLADLSPERAVVVDVGDNAALAREVLKLLDEPGRQQAIRERAYAWSRVHNFDWAVEQHALIYEGLRSV